MQVDTYRVGVYISRVCLLLSLIHITSIIHTVISSTPLLTTV